MESFGKFRQPSTISWRITWVPSTHFVCQTRCLCLILQVNAKSKETLHQKHNKYHPKQNNMTGLHIHLKMYSDWKKWRNFPASQISFQGWYLKEEMWERFQVKVPHWDGEAIFVCFQDAVSVQPSTKNRPSFHSRRRCFLPPVFYGWLRFFFKKRCKLCFVGYVPTYPWFCQDYEKSLLHLRCILAQP